MEDVHKNPDKYIKRIAQVYLSTTIEEELGWLDLPPKTRIKCTYGVINHPSAEGIRDDIKECMIGAAIATGIAAIASGGAAALAAFKTTVYGCLTNKGYGWADEIQVDVRTSNQDHGDWRKC